MHLSKRDNPNAPLAGLQEQFGIKPKSGDPNLGLFYMGPSAPPIVAKCMDAATDLAMKKEDGKVTMVECPPGCYEEYKKQGGGELV